MTSHPHPAATAGAVARQALVDLPARLRTPYVMRRMSHATDADISDALGLLRPLVSRRARQAERRLQAAFIRAGISVLDGDAALDEYLTVPPASVCVPRVMQAISRASHLEPLPTPPAPAPDPSWVEKTPRRFVALALGAAALHAARAVCLAIHARWGA